MTAVPGPTYAEMLDPRTLPADLRAAALEARADELDPLNLFNITWRNPDGRVRHVVLPPALTGVKANIVVMLGCAFPSGSHKVGPAYSTLAENESAGRFAPGTKPATTMVGPSTGNFGIGVTYVSKLKGYPALVVMPEGMSAERYERIEKYGGKLDLTPGSESDVILVLERVEEVKRDPTNFILAQFELMPNYRFHRHVTGGSVLEAAAGVGDGKVAAFVSAPGSAGTLAAGDAVKAKFPDAKIVAVEPEECSTLFNGGQGSHRIEGIGDKMVVLIHNVGNTDYVLKIHDYDTVKGLRVLNSGAAGLSAALGGADAACDPGAAAMCPRCAALRERDAFDVFRECFGVSSVCNILGAIRTARHLDLPAGANVVTIATDGFDRYPSVMADLEARNGAPIDDATLARWLVETTGGYDAADFLDVSGPEQQTRLHGMKRDVWTRFGYSAEYIDGMRDQAFWNAEYAKVPAADAAIVAARGF